MIARLGLALTLVAAGYLGSGAAAQAASPSALESVRPLIGTADHGHVFPGATVPFGMVQLSPDTRTDGWDGCSGYHYPRDYVMGFSHTHLSGTGIGDMGDIRVVPVSGDIPAKTPNDGYHLAFSHSDEIAEPGRYRVTLKDPKVECELSATAHAGFHRYVFPADKPAHLVWDLVHGIGGGVRDAGIMIESNTVISGQRHTSNWAKDKTFYFVAEFSRPFDSSGIDVGGKPSSDPKQGKGGQVMAHVDFKPGSEPIMVKVGLSATSVEGARANLKAEIPAWDLAGTVAAAKKSWSDILDRIDIQTDNAALRETFYTALYHSAMAPTLFNDADGAYRGIDGQVHKPEGFQNYCTFSLWDTFRAEHPLLTLVQPQRVDDFVNTMLAHQKQTSLHVLPVWSLAGTETWCMIGNHAIPVIVDAYAKGFHGFDAETAYQAMRASVEQNTHGGMAEYRKLGYYASGNERVAKTVEFAYDDWCVGRMASLLGKTDDAALFTKRGQQNYRNVFDPAVGFLRGKSAAGEWAGRFDPAPFVRNDFTEGTSWNYTFFMLQDLPGLIELLKGDAGFIAKLDTMFDKSQKITPPLLSDFTGIIGQYVHGNEPCHHIPYLYAYAGAPAKSAKILREIMNTLYTNKPDGICGNDDCGQMSAWYVLSAMGFYEVNPASGVYVIGSPLVNKATIQLDPKFHKGKTFTLVAENNSAENMYVQSATLNGKPLQRCWFTHTELAAGGELVLKMGSKPNPTWGARPEDRPPTVAPDQAPVKK